MINLGLFEHFQKNYCHNCHCRDICERDIIESYHYEILSAEDEIELAGIISELYEKGKNIGRQYQLSDEIIKQEQEIEKLNCHYNTHDVCDCNGKCKNKI